MINPKYQFIMADDKGNWQARPMYDDGITLEMGKEQGGQYFRKRINGKLKLFRYDYERVMSGTITTKYAIHIGEKADDGRVIIFASGYFYLTDCKVDEDNKIIEVQPHPLDDYGALLDAMETQYNIVKLLPEKKIVEIKKRTLLQIYNSNDTNITTYIGGLYSESECEQVSDVSKLIRYYHFGLGCIPVVVTKLRGEEVDWYGILDNYETYYSGIISPFPGSSDYIYMKYEVRDGVPEKFFTTAYIGGKQYNSIGFTGNPSFKNDFELTVHYGQDDFFKFNLSLSFILTRRISDRDRGGAPQYRIPADDISIDNKNYRYTTGIAYKLIAVSNTMTSEPTEYGVNESGLYYLPPFNVKQRFYPVAKATWHSRASFWLDSTLWVSQQSEDKTFRMTDGYLLSSVISKLLEVGNTGLTFQPTEEYSEFLYGGGSLYPGELVITPKSNITAGEYTQAAQKAEISLKDIFDMFANAMQCYWYVEAGKLKIENEIFFYNGGTYRGERRVGLDLTKLQNVRNGKSYAYGMNKYTFLKSDIPGKYTFRWMDDTNIAFNGYPFEFVGNYTTKGQTEERSINVFTSDIDYLILNPGEVSKDGFAIMACSYSTTGKTIMSLPMESVSIGEESYLVQNPYLSMFYLRRFYEVLPTIRYNVNGVEYRATAAKKYKIQEVTYPLGDIIVRLNVINMIKTGLGDGEIQKISINLLNKQAKATLHYAAE